MTKLEQHREVWPNKSDEWLFERLANELKDKVETIHKLLTENEQLRTAAVSGSVFFTTEEVKALKRVRNYFGGHDKTLFEHWAYSYLDNILKRIHTDR